MQDNKNGQGRDSMDELIERLKKHAEAPAESAESTADTHTDDELRQLLMRQLENKDTYERSSASELSIDGFSPDEFEEEDVETVEEAPEEYPEEEIFEEETDEEAKITTEDIDNTVEAPVEENFPTYAFSPTAYETAEEEDEEELPDEAQIAIDIFVDDQTAEEESEEDIYHSMARSAQMQRRAPSTDAFINGRTSEDILTDEFLSGLDEKTRARLLGEEYAPSFENSPARVVEKFTPDESDILFDDQLSAVQDSETSEFSQDDGDLAEELPAESQKEEPVSAPHGIDPLQMGFDNEKAADTVQIPDSGSISDTDVEMLLRLGYESSLRRMIGDARVERIRRDKIELESVDSHAQAPFAYRGREYSGREMTAEVQKAYARDHSVGIARMLYTLIFAIILFIYDELPLIIDTRIPLRTELSGFVGSRLYPLIGIALLIVGIIPCITRLFKSAISALRLEPDIYALPAISILAAIANNVGYLFRANSDIPAFFGGASLCILLIATVADLVLLRGQELAFGVVSSGKEKFLLADGEYSSASNDGHFDGNRYESDSRKCYRVRRTYDLSSYFARTAKYAKISAFLNYIIPICLGSAVIVGGIALLSGKGGLTFAMRSAATAYFLMTPGLFAIGTTLPLFLSNNIISRRGCAVIGTAAPDDYNAFTRFGKDKKIFFSDGDALNAAYIKRINLRGDTGAEHYVSLANKLFFVLGGVLSAEHQTSVACLPDVSRLHIEIAESQEHFLKLYMIDGDESAEIIMGSYDKLTRNGIKLPNENMEKIYNDDRRDRLVVYLAFDGQFRLAYSIQYRLSAKFRRTAKQLARMGFVPSVETYDPMITSQMLSELHAGDVLGEDLTISRADHFDGTRPQRSCGLVATSNSLRLYYPLASCEHMRKAYGEVKALTVALCFIGFATTAVVLFTGVLEFVRPWMVMAWQLMFGGICALAVYGEINKRTLFQSGAVKPSDTVKKANAPEKKKKAEKKPAKEQKKTKEPKVKKAASKAKKPKKEKRPTDAKDTNNEQ